MNLLFLLMSIYVSNPQDTIRMESAKVEIKENRVVTKMDTIDFKLEKLINKLDSINDK